MKKLLKLYKMFYRLLRLKAWQRLEIQNHEKFVCRLQIEKCLKEFFDLKTIFNDYKKVMIQHRIHSPAELFRALENQPVKEDLTRTEFVALRSELEAQYDNEEIRKQLLLEGYNENMPYFKLNLQNILNEIEQGKPNRRDKE